MSTLFQLGVLLLFSVGAVQGKERIFSDSRLVIKTYEYNVQNRDEATPPCVLCNKILRKVFRYIGDDFKKEKINIALNNACDYKNSLINSYCTAFMKKYKKRPVKVIMCAMDADDACKDLRMCQNSKV